MSKAILYDLGIAVTSITLWLTPHPVSRALGYSLSIVFSGRAYYTGICLLSKEKKEDEKEAITYEAETDFYDQLLGTNIDAALEIRTLEVENRMLARMIPLLHQKTQLEKQLQSAHPIHPEMTDEDRERAARSAIDNAFVSTEKKSDHIQQISEEAVREKFPEQLDSTSWKAILKALQNGADKAEIVNDVLGCNDNNKALGNAYFEYLNTKFL